MAPSKKRAAPSSISSSFEVDWTSAHESTASDSFAGSHLKALALATVEPSPICFLLPEEAKEHKGPSPSSSKKMKKKLAATASSKKVKVEIPPTKAAMKKLVPVEKKKKKAEGEPSAKRTTRSATTKTAMPESTPSTSKKGKKLHRQGKPSAAPASAPPFTSNRKQKLRPRFGKTVLTGRKPKTTALSPVVEISEEETSASFRPSPFSSSAPFSSPKVKRGKQKTVSPLPLSDSSPSFSAEPSPSSSAPPSPKMKDREKKGPAKPPSISFLLLNANARSYFNMVEEIPILNVKPVNLKKDDPFIREIIERQGWNKWLFCNISVYPLIVLIFFANMKIDFENRTLETSVQGKSITITGDDLTSFFGFSTPTDLIIVIDLQVESSSFSDIESTLS
ncbi:hypothetical protein AXF42_Ash000204 [Apostasia shenzhenica]|uniref:Uncharacterized protein n=1 Tax=Apostasia shenzhenica TaxID=1088818 RepID=A0A2I0AFP8_9ASPA|nr:hypothetical protein AXF42_Ash000204 [Apostasia shenzhenica]